MDAAVDEIVHAATVSDGAVPVDEATRIALADGVGRLRLSDRGFAFVNHGELALVVHPDARGRGVGDRLLTEVDEPGPLLAWSHGNHPAAAALAVRHGWERVRDLWVMRLPASPVDPPVVEGVTIRAFEPDDAAEVVRINAAAFAEHPEQGEMDLANLSRRMAEPWFDPDGLLVADSGRGLLGFHWTKRHNSAEGEVYVLGVDPSAQGRGLGRALTLAGLAHLAGLGVSEVILYVESSNHPAIGLYDGLGFTHDASDTHVQYRRGCVSPDIR